MADLMRVRVSRASAVAAALVVIPVAILVAAPPAAADVPIEDVCVTTTAGTTITLEENCTTNQALTIPDGFTLNGNDLTITAENPPAPAHTYTGAVVTNEAGATSMNIENLTITGPATGFPFPLPAPSCNTFPGPALYGIFFNDASGSVNNVEVLNIFQTNTAPGSPACNVGHSIRADGATADRTVTISATEVSNYQKGGLFASGRMTMNVTESVIGPPSFVPFSIAQNGVSYTNSSTNSNPPVGASGTMTANTIFGSSYGATGPVDPAAGASTAVLLFGANNVTLDSNTFTGESDLGISVTAGSTNSIISFNAIDRSAAPDPDSFGIGVSVDPDLVATTRLICNTFSLWNTDIDPAELVQEACPPPPTTTTVTPTPTSTPPVTPTVAAKGDPDIAATGAGDGLLPTTVIALMLLAAGAVLTAIGRRRHRAP